MPVTIAATRDSNLASIEADLAALPGRMAALTEAQRSAEFRIPSASNDLLADIWLAMAVGTAATTWNTDIIARGSTEISPQSPFLTSLPLLAGLRTARWILPEAAKDKKLDAPRAGSWLVSRDGGLIPAKGGGQTLLEIDPDFPVAGRLRASGRLSSVPSERRRMFTQLVLHLRKQAEIGALRRQIDPVAEGPGGAVGRFLFELHENALEHGSRDPRGGKIPGSRLLRIRKHIANSAEELAGRSGGFPALAEYIAHIKAPGLIEASISDFGAGIVDGFLLSPAGADHASRDRRELLSSLLFERLSSKGMDAASGLGIQRALRAANLMQAFVSLRTAEFWLFASFADARPHIAMFDVPLDGPRGKVRGTHWQFLWPQP